MSARHYMQFLRFYGLYLLPLCHCCRRLHDGIRRRGWEDVAVLCGLGRWLLYRHDPRRSERGENPLQLDCPEPKLAMAEAMAGETASACWAIAILTQARALTRQAQAEALQRWHQYAARAAAPADASKGAPP